MEYEVGLMLGGAKLILTKSQGSQAIQIKKVTGCQLTHEQELKAGGITAQPVCKTSLRHDI